MLFKMTLAFLAIVSIASDKFPPINGTFEKRGREFQYSSSVEIKENRYYVKNFIKCNTATPICLSWPIAGILCDNTKPLRAEASKEFQVKYPYHCRIATIYLGANLNDPVENVECYIDEDRINTSGENFKTKINYLNEIGESMSVLVTSSYIPQIQTSTIELEAEGVRGILIEKDSNLIFEDKYQVDKWDIDTYEDLADIFYGNDHFIQLSEYLQPKDSRKTYFYCEKQYDRRSSKIVFSSKGLHNESYDKLFCLISENRRNNIAFSAKVFVSK